MDDGVGDYNRSRKTMQYPQGFSLSLYLIGWQVNETMTEWVMLVRKPSMPVSKVPQADWLRLEGLLPALERCPSCEEASLS